MATYAIKIENLDALRNAMRQFPEIAAKHLQTAVEEGVAIIHERSARSVGIVPVKTGNLSNSFSTGIAIGRLYGRIGPTAHYARYVNDGTKKMRARRYMEKLEAVTTPKINERFVKALDRVADEIANRSS
ncbi:MAG: HK97-gp10 family putative phage morphogenesis protein [Patescibacteria group bacterium]